MTPSCMKGYNGWSEPEDEDDYQSRRPFDVHAYHNALLQQNPPPYNPYAGLPNPPVNAAAAAAVAAAAAAAASTVASAVTDLSVSLPPPKRRYVGGGKRVTVKPFVYGLHASEIDEDFTAFGL